jgi:hypothetical protein
MMLCNNTSRFDVAVAAVRAGAQCNAHVAVDSHAVVSRLMHLKQKERQWIVIHGKGTSIQSNPYNSSYLHSWLKTGRELSTHLSSSD